MKKIFGGAFLLAISSLLSRLLGILRSNQLATVFGAGEVTSSYFAGFTIPDFLYSFLIYGAVSASFVPIFTELHDTENESDPWHFTSNVLTVLLGLLFVFGGMVWLFAPQIVALLYAGFTPSAQNLTVELLRILILSPLLFGLSAVFGGVQTALGKFTAYAIAPLLYNLAIIFGIVYFREIHAVAWCAVAGAGLHALVQFIAVRKHGFFWCTTLRTQFHHVREFLWLSLPRIFAIVTTQINIVVDASIASLVPFGSLAILRYAQDINSFPMGIVGLSVATSSFGLLASLAGKGDPLAFADVFRKNFHRILFWILPSAVGLYLLRFPITELILQGGAFTTEDTIHTANTIAYLALGLVGTATIPFLSRTFYAQKNTRLPLYAGIVGVLINLVLDLILYRSWGVYGLAFASSISALTQMLILIYFLTEKINWRHLFSFRILSETAICTLAMWFVLAGVLGYVTAPVGTWNLLIYLAGISTLGGVIYLGLTYALGTFQNLMQK